MRHTLRKSRTHRKKRRTRKQSGGRVDMKKLGLVLNNRSRAAKFAKISAKKAEALKKQLESL